MDSTTRTYGDAVARSPLPIRLVVTGGAAAPYRWQFGSCVVGAGQDADLILDDETVSRRHVELRLVPEGVEVVDLGSRNGTFYLGQRVQHMVLSIGSRLRVGRLELRLEADSTAFDGQLDAGADRYGNLLGASVAMRGVYRMLERLEGSLVSVLIGGESGTGKEVVARAIHQRSLVADGPFVAINCGALDRALVRSELFGHARGAFTGASESRAGAFEAASNGTLFLDEIAELPLDAQPVLLRVLETGTVQRLGETNERKVKVRLLAATHRRLDELVKEGKFREDLYYRLLVVYLALPPLRERREDIAQLVRHFVAELEAPAVGEDVVAEFAARTWPGNIRELRNAVQAYVALGVLPSSGIISEVGLDAALRAMINLERPYAQLKEQVLERFQRLYLELLMAHTKGNQTEASRISGVERSHLNKVLRQRH